MDDVLVIEDLARDRRFARNSLVKERGLRFYAGAPLRTTGGHVLGALCVLDTKPRHFGDHDKRLLQVMAEEVMEAINLRAASRDIGGGVSAQLRICAPSSVLALLAEDRTDFKKSQTIGRRATARPLAFSAKLGSAVDERRRFQQNQREPDDAAQNVGHWSIRST
jgi:GAF domain-containing protein